MRWFHTKKGNAFEWQLDKFERDLMALRQSDLTLSRIARDAVDIFGAEYCSIHACGNGDGWKNFSGVATGELSDCPDVLAIGYDHMAGTLELAEEQQLGVRNFLIPCNDKTGGLLVMKCELLSDDQIREIASAIGAQLSRAEIFEAV